jgi:zinc and cadmium transporter
MALFVWAATLAAVLAVSLISFAGIFALTIKENKLKSIVLLLVSFSAGALLGDAFIHLLPEVIRTAGFNLGTAIAILLGILVFFVLEKFICWRHCHVPTSEHHPHPLAFMNLIGDGFHNFLDGMIIAGSFLVDFRIGIATTIAVILHEIPQEISDLGVLIHAGISRKKALFFNFLSALTSFLGAIITLSIGQASDGFIMMITSFTVGSFIYIASADLIPELHKETAPKKSAMQLLGITLGILVMMSLLLLEH